MWHQIPSPALFQNVNHAPAQQPNVTCCPFLDLHFREYAARFEEAAPGTRMEIPINPRNWSMELIKK